MIGAINTQTIHTTNETKGILVMTECDTYSMICLFYTSTLYYFVNNETCHAQGKPSEKMGRKASGLNQSGR